MRGHYGDNSPEPAAANAPEPAPSNVPGVVSILAVLGGFLIARRMLTSPHWFGR